jgi:hypothetical protein
MDHYPPAVIEHTVAATLRDSQFDIQTRIPVRFSYNPADPYALSLYITGSSDGHTPGEILWAASRDAFLVACDFGISLPGMDLVVAPVLLELARPGHPAREVAHLRVTIQPSHEADRRIGTIHLDIRRADLRPFLRRIVDVVPVGCESGYLDLDTRIAQLLEDRY